VIATPDAAAAAPIVAAWQATAGDATAVHRVTAGAFHPAITRTLVAAPRLAVLKDGNEQIAFNDLNAAGIPDSTGGIWGPASPDLLTEAQVAGGALRSSLSGAARYCHLSSMHYPATASTNDVVQAVRTWLDADRLTHGFMQCEAARVFENAASGRYLTNAGIADDGAAPVAPLVRVPGSPLAQIDGSFEADSGAVDSIGAIPPAAGPELQDRGHDLINETGQPLLQRIVCCSADASTVSTNGRVTYLAGHDYDLGLPVSTHPQTNGVRLFLNSIFESLRGGRRTGRSCADEVGPATVRALQITYTIATRTPARTRSRT
jgi:hypothetical protein